MRLKLAQRHRRMHRSAVVHDVQIALRKSTTRFPSHPQYKHPECSTLWERSSRRLGAGGHFEHLQRNPFADHGQGPPNPVASDASANRIKIGGKAVHFLADACRLSLEFLLNNVIALFEIRIRCGRVRKSLQLRPAKQSEMPDHPTAPLALIRDCRIPTSDRTLRSRLPESKTRARTLPDIDHVAFLSCENHRDPVFEGGRIRPQVDHHIVDRPCRAAHKFASA